MKAKTLLNKAAVDWEKAVDRLSSSERDSLRRELEGMSLRAAMLGAYLDYRHGFGCGDQGHGSAVKRMNRAGRLVWRKVFGYNAFHDLSI